MTAKNHNPVQDLRIGHGYDIHGLVADPGDGAGVRLAGVHIPCPFRIVAHSDGDIVTHAVIDAILGALALGDIGDHFPDSDPANEGRNSLNMLADLLGRHCGGWRVINVDATVVAEQPKLAQSKAKMRQNLAVTLGIAPECVSIKATTHERLDSIGAGEAIACHAVALLARA